MMMDVSGCVFVATANPQSGFSEHDSRRATRLGGTVCAARRGMGFALQMIELLLKDHLVRPLEGPLLTLGRQTVIGTHEQVLAIFNLVGVKPAPLPASMAVGTTVFPDQLLFARMGLESKTLDLSGFESPDIIQDLNEPIAESQHGQFKTVIDGGTIEHIFDLRAGFTNIVDLLAPEGRVIHISPVNNYVNHGFWQLCPTSFFDFYEANGFTDLQALMIVQPRLNVLTQQWATFVYDRERFGYQNSLWSSRDDQLVCMFSAQKTHASTSRVIPTQWYQTKFEQARREGRGFDGPHFTLEYTVNPPGLNITEVPAG
jgi:hypothetical protein